MDVQVEAQCGSHGESRVSVGPWLLSALALPQAQLACPFQIGMVPMDWSIGGCCFEGEAPWLQLLVSG